MALENVSMSFGNFAALSDLNFDVRRGEILGVAGPNGAGKSTLLNVCTGGLFATAGRVSFNGQHLKRTRRFECCHRGIARTFQIPKIFSSLTVEENVATGKVFGREGRPPVAGYPTLEEILELTGLSDKRTMAAHRADLMARKSIMLAGALATAPQIVFMDEPLGGLNAEEIEAFSDLVSKVHTELGVTFVLVEHKTKALAKLSDRILILNFGKLVLIDTPEVVLNDPHVVDIYLGTKHNA
jgi:branched-chain amino acid transport system ATP-binding protein